MEIRARRENFYPPFAFLANLVFAHPRPEAAEAAARQAASLLQGRGWADQRGERQFVGPAACPLARLRGLWRYQLLMKALRQEDLSEGARALLHELPTAADLRVTLDLDPHDMM